MQCDIRIRSPTYPLTTDLIISHDSEETILQLKSKIRIALSNPALLESAQKLIYSGHVLEDHKTLTQHNIPSNATFHLVTPPSILPLSAQPSVEPLEADFNAQAPSHNSTMSHPEMVLPYPSSPSTSSDPIASSLPIESSEIGVDSENASSNQIPATASHDIPASQQLPAQFPGLSAAAQPFLAEHAEVQRTSVKYELCYIDGFPYLVRSNDRRSRNLRRPRLLSSILGDPAHVHHSTVPATGASPPRSGSLAIRQHHVDLPATAAIPVRTAEGRRALILSPEGVRAMAAQGVNVETAATNRSVLGFTSLEVRHFMSTSMPYAWLALKLAFIVGMLGTNSTWSRFLILNVVAMIIFLWQSGILGRAFSGQTRRLLAPGEQPGAPQANAVGGIADIREDERNLPDTTGIETSQITPASTNHSRNHIGTRAAPTPQHTWLHSFSNAFISSIMPGTPHRGGRLIREPAEVAVAQRDPDVPSPGRIQDPATSATQDFSESLQNSQGSHGASGSSQTGGQVGAGTVVNENEIEEENQAQVPDNLARDW